MEYVKAAARWHQVGNVQGGARGEQGARGAAGGGRATETRCHGAGRPLPAGDQVPARHRVHGALFRRLFAQVRGHRTALGGHNG